MMKERRLIGTSQDATEMIAGLSVQRQRVLRQIPTLGSVQRTYEWVKDLNAIRDIQDELKKMGGKDERAR